MKKLTIIFAMLVLALTACTGQESKQRHGVSPMTTEEKEVYAAYVAINNAMIKKDRAAMELHFDKNLIFTHMSGKKQTREEFIGEIMDGTLNYFKVDTKDYSISVKGDTTQMKVTHTLHGKSLWHKQQLDYEWGKHLQKAWRNLGQDKIKNYFLFSNFCKSLKT